MRNRLSTAGACVGALVLGIGVLQAGLPSYPVTCNLMSSANGLVLSWLPRSSVTNEGRTLIFPGYVVLASVDLTNWWETALTVPRQIGGPPRLIQTNLANVNLPSGIYVRVRSEPVDLVRANLSDADLRDVDLSGQDLSYADFTGADLIYSDFDLCDFRGANLSQITSYGCSFFGAQFFGPP